MTAFAFHSTRGKAGNTKEVKGQVKEQVNDKEFRVTFENGKQKIYEYEELVDKINKDDDDDEERWTFEEILSHRWSPLEGRNGKIDLLLKWKGYEDPTWEPLEVIKADDPITVAKYAKEHNLLTQAEWKWARRYVKNEKKLDRELRQMLLAKAKRSGTKYHFGIRVPKSLKEAYELDKVNKDSAWADAIQKEVTLLYEEYKCFKVLEESEPTPEGYQPIPLLWTFAVKYDGRRRARCVAGGHMTPDLEDDLYSGVVDLEAVRLAFVAAALMDLEVITAGIGSA